MGELARYRATLRAAGWVPHLGGPLWIAPEDWSTECNCPIGWPPLWSLGRAYDEQVIRDMHKRNGTDIEEFRRLKAMRESYGTDILDASHSW